MRKPQVFKILKGLIAFNLGLAAIAGCSAQVPGGVVGTKAPAAAQALKQPLPAGWFSAPLKAPAGLQAAPNYGVNALPSFPHLLGPTYPASNSTCAGVPVKAFNVHDQTYLVVFQDGFGNVMGRINDDHGVVIISDFLIASGASQPRVVYIPDLNQWVVIYRDFGTEHILLERFGSAGSLIGTPTAATVAASDKESPDLAYDPINHRLLTTWADSRSGNYDVYTRLFLFTGTQILASTGEMLAINSPPDVAGNLGDHFVPRVAFSTTTQTYVVVCEDTRNFLTTGTDVFGQKVTSTGNLLGGNFAVSALNQRQGNPAIAYNPNTGFFLVVFEDESNGTSDMNILGRALDAGGTPIFSEGTVTNQFGVQELPAVAFNTGSWTWLVAWEDLQGSSSTIYSVEEESECYASRLTTTIQGRHLGPYFEFGDSFSITPLNNGADPAIAANPTDQDFNVIYDQLQNGPILDQRVDRGY